MNTFTPFANFLAMLLPPLSAGAQSISQALTSSTDAKAIITLALMVSFIHAMYRGGSDAWSGFGLIFWCALVYGYLWTGYNQNVNQLLVQQVPKDLTMIVAASAGTGGTPADATAFDVLINRGFDMGVGVFAQLPKASLMTVGLVVAIVLYWIGMALSIAYGFMMFLGVQIGLFLLAAIGPLAIPFLFWPGTRHIGFGWMAAIASAILTQVLIVTVVAIELVAITKLLDTMLNMTIASAKAGATTALPDFAVGALSTVSPDAGHGNEVAMLQVLIVALTTFAMSSYALSYTRQIASHIFRGAYIGGQGFAASAQRGALAASNAVAGGGGGGGVGAPVRSSARATAPSAPGRPIP